MDLDVLTLKLKIAGKVLKLPATAGSWPLFRTLDYKKSKTKTIMFWKVVLYSDSRSQHIIRQDIYIYNVDNSDFTRVRMACTSL